MSDRYDPGERLWRALHDHAAAVFRLEPAPVAWADLSGHTRAYHAAAEAALGVGSGRVSVSTEDLSLVLGHAEGDIEDSPEWAVDRYGADYVSKARAVFARLRAALAGEG